MMEEEEEEEVEEEVAAAPPPKDGLKVKVKVKVKVNQEEPHGVNHLLPKDQADQVNNGVHGPGGEVGSEDEEEEEEDVGVNGGVAEDEAHEVEEEDDDDGPNSVVCKDHKDGDAVASKEVGGGVSRRRFRKLKDGVNREAAGSGVGKVKDGVNAEEEEVEEEERANEEEEGGDNDGHAALGRASGDAGDKVWRGPSSATILTAGGVSSQEPGREELANNGVERPVGEEEEEGELDDDDEEGDGTLFFLEKPSSEDDGDAEQQAAFVRGLMHFFTERHMEYKHPKFYGENLNCLKLWRAVVRLGGYDAVTNGKLWRQVGETFSPPKTCTTVSWTFRGFYEKALLDYERFKLPGIQPNAIQQSSHSEALSQLGEAPSPSAAAASASASASALSSQQQYTGSVSTSGRARRDAAARAMQGWHSQRILGSGEVGDPIIKDKNNLVVKKEKQLKSLGIVKKRKASTLVRAVKAARTKGMRSQLSEHNPIVAESGYDAGINLDRKKMVKLENPQYGQNDCDSAGVLIMDDGPRADWVKINVHKTHDCFEIYALVPGLLREEVRIQCEPDGQLVINGEPDQLDNPWGITPFKKVIYLPLPIDTQQTSAVVALHGQLFVRAPYAVP